MREGPRADDRKGPRADVLRCRISNTPRGRGPAPRGHSRGRRPALRGAGAPEGRAAASSGVGLTAVSGAERTRRALSHLPLRVKLLSVSHSSPCQAPLRVTLLSESSSSPSHAPLRVTLLCESRSSPSHAPPTTWIEEGEVAEQRHVGVHLYQAQHCPSPPTHSPPTPTQASTHARAHTRTYTRTQARPHARPHAHVRTPSPP